MVISRVLTGRGADIILIDDPLKPEEALSETQRQAANDWYDHTLYSRQNDKRRGAIVTIMQRLHEDDLIGHLLAQEPWEVLSFPTCKSAGNQEPTRNRCKALIYIAILVRGGGPIGADRDPR